MFKLISKFIIQILVNGLGIWIISEVVPGVSFSGDWLVLAEVAAVLAILNVLVKPVLKFFFGPLIILTFGLASLLLNALILWAVTQIFPTNLVIPVGWSLIWATLIISLINFAFNLAKKSD
ncbi:MAG TPA: phage holin family protein [Candidatus Paceibacterota bacterium]|jgi:putative membrane protein|nr:phage holin family protein [Candidatus Paceibacterota bacterium]HPT40071.1 phage holin family protein [Candidatus Paceibacterota bacterium]